MCVSLVPIPAYAADRVGLIVRTHSTLRNCVAFVGTEDQGRFTPMGTAFFVGMQLEDVNFVFLATASHVLDMISRNEFSVRLNRKDGPAECVKMPKSRVFKHPGEENDLSLIASPFQLDVYDIGAVNVDRNDFNNLQSTYYSPHLGDEVYALGLYTSHHGNVRNIPVARNGNIAAMPEEKVRGPFGRYLDAYLVELRTIAGLSGSPVFMNVPPMIVKDGKPLFSSTSEPVLPLGMIIGYHVIESEEDQIPVPRFGGVEAGSDDSAYYSIDERNTGFSVVVPFERIIEMFEQDPIKSVLSNSIYRHREASVFRHSSIDYTKIGPKVG